jgi:hypothetical protein
MNVGMGLDWLMTEAVDLPENERMQKMGSASLLRVMTTDFVAKIIEK